MSDELVETFTTDHFYMKHVRWDVQRYRPSDAVTETNADIDSQSSPAQIMSEQTAMINIEANEATGAFSTSARPKRKIPIDENQENQIRTQPRRIKKNH